jgi:hypothetical protein
MTRLSRCVKARSAPAPSGSWALVGSSVSPSSSIEPSSSTDRFRLSGSSPPSELVEELRPFLERRHKALWLCARRDTAQAFNFALTLAPLPGHVRVLEADNGADEPFASETDGHLIAAGRYDGMDFPGDTCRVEILPDVPVATSDLEEFVSAYLRDAPFAATRFGQRVAQALPRRSCSDRAASTRRTPRCSGWVCSPSRLGWPTLSASREAVVRPNDARVSRAVLPAASRATGDGRAAVFGISRSTFDRARGPPAIRNLTDRPAPPKRSDSSGLRLLRRRSCRPSRLRDRLDVARADRSEVVPTPLCELGAAVGLPAGEVRRQRASRRSQRQLAR